MVSKSIQSIGSISPAVDIELQAIDIGNLRPWRGETYCETITKTQET